MGVFKRPTKPKKGHHQYWWIRFQHKGYDYRESTGFKVGEITKDQARSILKNRQLEIKSGKRIISTPEQDYEAPDSTTLYDMSLEYVKQKKGEGKKSWNRDVYSINNLIDFFGSKIELNSIDSKKVGQYKSHRLKTRKPETVNHELICLGAIINMARDWAIFSGKNPVYVSGLVKFNREKRRILTPEEDEQLLSVASEHFGYIIIGALNTAMRRTEIANAKIENVNLNQEYIFVPASKTTDPREVPLNAIMMKLIPKLIERSKDSYLFTNRAGYRYEDENSLGLIFRRLCKKLILEGVSFHSLRHTSATRMLEGKEDKNGNKVRANLVDVQLILGHKNPKTTMIYLHPDESLKKAVSLLE